MSNRFFAFIFIASGAVFIYMLGMVVMKSGVSSQNETEFEYNMPRPQSQLSDFDLSDRDIETIKISKQKQTQAGAVTEHKLIPLPDKDAKKKEDQKKAEAKKRAEAQKKALAAQKKMQIQINNSKDESWSVSESNNSNISENQGRRGGNYNYNKPENKTDANDSKQQKEKINWLEILMAQPTKDNANKMLASFAEGETARTEYFQVATTLLKDNGNNRHEIGLYLLSKAQGPEALMALIDYSANLEEADKTEIQQNHINNYAQAAFYPAIASLVSNPSYSEEALRLASFAVVKMSSLQPSVGPTRGGITRTFMSAPQNSQFQPLKVFLTPLNGLVKKNADESSVNLAKTLINQINQLLQINSATSRTAEESSNP